MSPDKDEGNPLRNHLSDLIVYGLVLVVLLVALKIRCIRLDLTPEQGTVTVEQQPMSPEEALHAIHGQARLCTSEADIEVVLHRERTIQRFILPDGHLDVTAFVSGTVRASVDLTGLQASDLEISSSRGSVLAVAHLPPPQVTGVRLCYPTVTWDYTSNWPLVWDSDTEALQIRADLLEVARQVLPEKATQAGLLLEAERTSIEIVTQTLQALGADEVKVIISESGTDVLERRGYLC